jgi:outer membrane protein assembly factor BamA
VAIFLVVGHAVCAERSGEAGERWRTDRFEGSRVKSIVLQGNDRTREVVVRRALSVAPGDPYTADTAERIEEDLAELGLFSSIEIYATPAPDGVEVDIVLEERWTLIPIPFMAIDSGQIGGGLFAIERNLFGLNKQLIAGGGYSTEGFTAVLAYNDPSLFGSRWVGSLSAGAGRQELETAGLAYDERWEYRAETLTLSGDLGYRFTEWLTVRGGMSYEQLEVLQSDRPETVSEGGSSYVRYRLESSVERPFGEGRRLAYFRERYRIGATLTLLQEPLRPSASGSAGVDVGLFRDQRLGLKLRGAAGDLPGLIAPRLGGRPTQRPVHSNTVVSNRYLSHAVEYELPLFRPDWATVTLLSFYDLGYDFDSEELLHGAGGGVRFYLSRVAIPALGFYAAWNAAEQYGLFNVSFGRRL